MSENKAYHFECSECHKQYDTVEEADICCNKLPTTCEITVFVCPICGHTFRYYEHALFCCQNPSVVVRHD